MAGNGIRRKAGEIIRVHAIQEIAQDVFADPFAEGREGVSNLCAERPWVSHGVRQYT
jgi:hypothetical protein